jgi:hypothetical protein
MRLRMVLSLTTLFMACFTMAVWSMPPLPDLEPASPGDGLRPEDNQARPTPIP